MAGRGAGRWGEGRASARFDRGESGLKVADWLRVQPEVLEVLHPALPGCRDHALWARDYSGACGLFGFVFRPAPKAAVHAFLDALELFGIGFSWGGYESLVIPFDPAGTRSATPWPPAAWNPADRLGIRLSIGLEDPDDLIADLEAAFAAMERG